MSKPIVAIMYDFDKTLCTRDMQEYTFIPGLGMQPDDFWSGTGEIASKEQMDSVLTYMYCMITKSEQTGKPFTKTLWNAENISNISPAFRNGLKESTNMAKKQA